MFIALYDEETRPVTSLMTQIHKSLFFFLLLYPYPNYMMPNLETDGCAPDEPT